MTRVLSLRKTLGADLTAGLTTALVTIPDGMASAILAGVSPIHGLYAPRLLQVLVRPIHSLAWRCRVQVLQDWPEYIQWVFN